MCGEKGCLGYNSAMLHINMNDIISHEVDPVIAVTCRAVYRHYSRRFGKLLKTQIANENSKKLYSNFTGYYYWVP